MFSRAYLASGAWVTARYVLVAAAGLVTSFGFANLATKETFGQYQFILALLALFSVFALPGLNIAAVKATAKRQPFGVLEAVRRSFQVSLMAVPLLLGSGWYLITQGEVPLGQAVALAGLLFPFYYAPNTWYAFYEGQLNFRPVAIRTTLSAAVVTAALFAVLLLGGNLLWLVASFFGVSAAFSAWFYLEIRRRILAGPPQRQRQEKKVLDIRYGYRVTAQKVAYTLTESLPPLAVSVALGHLALADFQLANIFLVGVSGLLGALAAIYLPRFFMEDRSKHRRVFQQNIIIGVIASLGYFVVVRLVFLPLYSESYHDSYLIAQALAALPLVIALRTFLVNYYTARDRNFFVIGVYLAANLVALLGFWAVSRESSFIVASVSYLYLLHLSLLLPLMTAYILTGERSSRDSEPRN